MRKTFDFNDLFVLDLANNHQGSVEHATNIIRSMAEVVHARGARAALKFQFRHLESFVHPAHQQASGNKHIPRFLSTKLGREDWRVLTDEVRRARLVTMATPFDEASVDLLAELDIEVIKVASCSATDWPLLEKIADADRPVLVSTGGLTLRQLDDVVSFLDHRRVAHALMHCVAIYPTPDDKLQLNQIELLRRRYPDKVIGFSTHEAPENLAAVQVAVAKGARILERHVGIATNDIKLNAYSSTPQQIDAWIAAALRARTLLGAETRPDPVPEESESLQSLRRGVYAKGPLKPGVALNHEDIYFAMPCVDGQLSSGEWKPGIVASGTVGQDAPLLRAGLQIPSDSDKQALFTAIHTIKGMLNEARIALNTEFCAEFSHHYGIGRFAETGATIIECVNRSYCKKLVIQTPGQYHPAHYHKKKEETFQILWGTLEMNVDGRRRTLVPGDIQVLQQGVWHDFWTTTGVIFEEISTTHFNDDSFYEDKLINRLDRSERKTVVNHWGRYQV
jgi:N-acetylneuraminate synthase